MKGRTTLVLLAGILVLGIFIALQETWRAKVPSKEYRRIKLIDLDAKTLASLQFQYSNTVVECVKDNGTWMTGGTDRGLGRADKALVMRLVASLNSMGKGTTITSKHLEARNSSADDFGFDHPAVIITAVDNQGSHEWQVGGATPLGNMVYVREGTGGSIYTVANLLLSMVPARPDDLRDRTLFAGEVTGVRRIEIRGGSGLVYMIKDPESGWQLQQPVAAPADPKAVDAYIEGLYHLRIDDFVADNVSDFSVYGLQAETRQISIGGLDGSSRMLILGDELPDRPDYLYARRADDTSVFSLRADVLELLNVPLNQFRNASVLSVPAKDISYVSVRHGTEELELKMEESGRWNIAKPVVWAADAEAVAELIKVWDEAVITEYNLKVPAEEPDWILTFGSSKLGKTNVVEVLPTVGREDGLLVRRAGEQTVFQINLPFIPADIVDQLTYKDRAVWELDRDAVQKISIGNSDEGLLVLERQTDGTFLPVGTNGNVRVDARATDHLLTRLTALRTLDYVIYNPQDLDVYGLAHPALELHLGLSGTNELGRVLMVGRETPVGFFSMVKGHDVVFLLDKAMVETLSQNLFEQQEPVVPVE